ncbi:MAG: ATP-binding protein [Erysipelotrichaceae bacterium]|nr:ATP-binding protein [Erysipelotrichaceae bacterium]MDD3924734.1 ATP-binding protein [Erysipelotrichaceae bacterium]MDD4642512.1 ATP-binding protein [Erysipelotrichaceae bacterium]
MKKIEALIKDSEELKKERQRITSMLKTSSLIKRYLFDHDIDPLLIDRYPMQFLRLYEQLEICDKCLGLHDCQLPNRGHYQALEYDGTLKRIMRPCRYQVAYNVENRHLVNYLINDIPDNMYNVTLEKIDISVEHNQEYLEAINKIWDWLAGKLDKGLFLYGKVGTGKTYLLACIANKFAMDNKKVAFVHMPKLLIRLKAAFNDDDEHYKIMAALINADFLVLDDIGAEPVTGWYRDEILSTILNERMIKQKLTCFSSNLDLKQLNINFKYTQKKDVDELKASRIMERINMLADPLEISGHNRRFQ